MLDSFITLNRRILEWEWYTDSNTMRLFIHCLLKANWKDKDWKGVVVKRGTFITSQQGLADQLGLSRKQIQLSLEKLIETKEIEKEGNNKYTLLTVVKYDDYQKNSYEEGQQKHNKSTSKEQQKHTTNNNNNYNNENNNIVIRGFEENFDIAISNDQYITAITSNLKISKERLIELYKEFHEHLKRTQDTVKSQHMYVSHFRNWYLKKYNINHNTGKPKLKYKNSL